MLWEQKLDELAAHIRNLEKDLADVDQLIACHAHTIDRAPRSSWPKDSILAKAIDRHAQRVINRNEEERRRAALARR